MHRIALRAPATLMTRAYARTYTRRHAMFALLCQMILYCMPLCFTAPIVDTRYTRSPLIEVVVSVLRQQQLIESLLIFHLALHFYML